MAPEEQNPKLLSPLTLAFVGDGVYELLVRKRIVEAGSMPPKKLNAHKVEMVRASAQAAVYDGLEPLLTEDERDMLKRGRRPYRQCAQKRSDGRLSQSHWGRGTVWLFVSERRLGTAVLFV